MSHNVIVCDTDLMITYDINSILYVITLQQKCVAMQE